MLPSPPRLATLDPYTLPKAPLTTQPTPSLSPTFPYTWQSNPYTSKRTWPPHFDSLSPKHRFSLERRYRRRAKLKWARPTWTKGVKLAQWGSILFVTVYGVLFMEGPEGQKGVFSGIRKWCGEQAEIAAGARAGDALEDNTPAAAKSTGV
ncbi:hypothetical protein B0A48_02438 [Cryoendolithus antarcticus]|uniref:Uncharacterized protein n=1 Tax=Cryoendolithus antarcticus TaxID=1507870 RepID=A0A1V8TNT8_9PEZI|nr:hypothetical protein B0A48_02438 [Cryoendolithus antarcticus]